MYLTGCCSMPQIEDHFFKTPWEWLGKYSSDLFSENWTQERKHLVNLSISKNKLCLKNQEHLSMSSLLATARLCISKTSAFHEPEKKNVSFSALCWCIFPVLAELSSFPIQRRFFSRINLTGDVMKSKMTWHYIYHIYDVLLVWSSFQTLCESSSFCVFN